jgi:cytochrome P450
MQSQVLIHAPADPLAAVTHENPYPYYAGLAARNPFYFDEAIGLWIATSAEAVHTVLNSPLCQVRPLAEPVPKTIAGSGAGDIFGRLIRMNEGSRHQPMKGAVSSTLAVVQPSHQWAEFLFEELRPDLHPERLSEFAFQMPAYVVGSLLGVPENQLSQLAVWAGEFVACFSPISSPERIEQGKAAADNLLALFEEIYAQPPSDGLLTKLAHEAKQVGQMDQKVIIANSIGFLFQAYEATAGLIGNTLRALASIEGLYEKVSAYPELLLPAIQEVMRYDPSIHNTRRFVAEDGFIAGQAVKQGEAILVILAAAGWDEAANPAPEHFDLFRENRHIFSFGIGAHACPGETLASSIASAALEVLLRSGMAIAPLKDGVTYRHSVNVRIPLFGEA